MMRGASSRPRSRGWLRAGVVLDAQVGVLHAGLDLPGEVHPEQTCQAEIPAADPTLIAQAGLVRRHQRAAARDEPLQLAALRVGEGDHVRENQRLERGLVEQPVVHHLERDPRFDERLVPPLDVILDSAINGPGGLLRVHEADARQGTIVAQVALPARQAAVEVLDRLQPALVVQRSAELREPRPHPVGDQVGHPQPDLRRVLHRVLPAVRLLDADAEEADDRFGAERRPVLLGVHPDGPRRHQARRAWRSAASIGASLPISTMSSRLVAPPPVFGITQESGLIWRTSWSHVCQRSKSRR